MSFRYRIPGSERRMKRKNDDTRHTKREQRRVDSATRWRCTDVRKHRPHVTQALARRKWTCEGLDVSAQLVRYWPFDWTRGEYSHTVPGNASRYVPGDGDQSAGHLQKSARSGTKRRQADRSRDAPTSGTVMLSIWAPPFYNTSSSNRSEKQPLWDSRLFLAEFGMKCRTKGVNSLPPACS